MVGVLERFQEKWTRFSVRKRDQIKNLEHFRAKWTPVRVKKMRPKKDLERFRDSVKFRNVLVS